MDMVFIFKKKKSIKNLSNIIDLTLGLQKVQ